MELDNLDEWRKPFSFSADINGDQYQFQSTWGLFSPKALDEGTVMLLHYLDVSVGADCLDLGCGYGPLGVYLARQSKTGKVVMVDKDFLAVEYANQNAKLNAVQAEARLSNGFSHVSEQFDLIVSNVPAKSGKELYYIMMMDAWQQLKPGGRFYIVTITGLRKFFERGFKEIFGNYKKVKQGTNYTVAFAEKVR